MGWVDNLINRTDEVKYVMIEVRPDGCISGSGLDITLSRRDMRSKFGYTMLCEIDLMLKFKDSKKVNVYTTTMD